ncbi:MAG: hypothetical protein QM523_11680, partial [Candidatus Pacebacteria bacterium]|nr:hypothetical protein [Candidatus Paceibacterota bacterium]
SSPSIGGNTSTATGGVGYGVSLGWTSKTGFGLSADYLGFNHKWTGLGTDGQGTQFNYDAPYHVMTITPSYRFKLDSADNWGLRVGLGVGFSLSDVSWANKTAVGGAQSKAGTKVAGGAVFYTSSAIPLNIFSSQPSLTGNCVSANSELPSGLVFSDSKGSTSLDASLADGAMNKCNKLNGGYVNAVNGLSDAQIVEALNNGKLVTFVSDSTNPIAYTVWSQVFGSNATILGINGLLNSSGNIFEPVSATNVAVTMNPTTWDKLTLAQQTKLKTTLGLVTNNITEPPTNNTPTESSGGSAKDDAGFVLAPQVALEYDNNLLHFDINVKYIHELFNVRYFGSEGSVSGTATSGAITYTSMAGPLALFIGAGLGINF